MLPTTNASDLKLHLTPFDLPKGTVAYLVQYDEYVLRIESFQRDGSIGPAIVHLAGERHLSLSLAHSQSMPCIQIGASTPGQGPSIVVQNLGAQTERHANYQRCGILGVGENGALLVCQTKRRGFVEWDVVIDLASFSELSEIDHNRVHWFDQWELVLMDSSGAELMKLAEGRKNSISPEQQ